MKQYFKSALLMALAYVCLAGGPASAAKIESVNNNGRIMPAPILVVGTYDEQGRSDICLVDRAGVAGGIGRSKVYVYVSLAAGHQTKRNIDATGEFTINMPDDSHIAQIDFCGSVSAASGDRYIDKFAITGLTPKKADLVNAPMVQEFPISMECRVVKKKTFGEGSHTMYIAEVLRVWVEESVMNGPDERHPKYPNPQKVHSIIYYAGSGTGYGYYKIGDMVGKPEDSYKSKYPNSGLLERD